MRLECQVCGEACDLEGLDVVPGGFGFACSHCQNVNLVAPVGPAKTGSAETEQPETRSADAGEPGHVPPSAKALPPDLVECPKCSHRQTGEHESCHRCGLNFTLVNSGRAQLPGDPLAGNPSANLLRAKWATLEQSLDDEEGHLAFIALCSETQALEFAGHCYRRLGYLDGEDERVALYRQKVIQSALVRAGRLDKRAETFAKNRLRGLMALLFGAFIMLGFVVGYYLLTRYQVFWQHNG